MKDGIVISRYRVRDHAEKLQVLFNTPDFCVTLVNDPVGLNSADL